MSLASRVGEGMSLSKLKIKNEKLKIRMARIIFLRVEESLSLGALKRSFGMAFIIAVVVFIG